MKTSDQLWRLRAIMVALEIENKELADMIGVSGPVISRLLSGVTDPAQLKHDTLESIHTALAEVVQAEPERFLPIEGKAQYPPTNRKAGG